MENIFYTPARTPWTNLLVASSERGLVAVSFILEGGIGDCLRSLDNAHRGASLVQSAKENRLVMEELSAYAAGDLQTFSAPLDLRGTSFQKSVWRALLEIPYGETRTYAAIARLVGRPNAFRAVGLANHSNPAAIVVPCHRVIASDGSLCGYGGGLELKRTLLEHERQHSRSTPRGMAQTLSFEIK
jgi:methylated-DNA-[protein]-cysteine S-methyltransferase